MKNSALVYDLSSISEIVEKLYSLRNEVKIYTFTGPLGAGKTTLVQQLLMRFGVTEIITSPTFTYVNTYRTSQGQTLYHFDLYRLKSLDEFLIDGFDELLYQDNSWTFIEWPEVIKPLLTHDICSVALDYEKFEKRILTILLFFNRRDGS